LIIPFLDAATHYDGSAIQLVVFPEIFVILILHNTCNCAFYLKIFSLSYTSKALLYQALILIGICSFGCKQEQSPSEDNKKAGNEAISIHLDLYLHMYIVLM